MESSRKSAEQTVGDIQRILGMYKAKSIHLEYDDRGEVDKVFFELERDGRRLGFRVPCRWEAVLNALMERRAKDKDPGDEDARRAKKIAWRQTYRWIEAQLAYVNTRMVKTEEVFLSYLVDNNGKTLFEAIEESGYRLLEYKKEKSSDGHAKV
jgi:hypothetical protein